jgi:putative transposase
VKRSWSRAAAITIGKSGVVHPDRDKWRTPVCASVSVRSLPAVDRPTAARGWLTSSAALDGATVSPASCARSDSSLGSAPSIDPRLPTAATADRLRLTASKTSPSNGRIKSGPPTPLASSPAKAGLYLVAVLDLFSRRVVGWAMSPILDAPLVIAALRMALGQRRPAGTLIVHSDRGAQFASAAYRQVLAQHGLLASMCRKGNCYDNAFIESFWSSLKYELVYHQRFATRAGARTAIFDYIETFYNHTRLHSSLDYLSPINFESQLN